jgi:peptidoglycan biosynthesis protein MviN/MurJ (putative lipid II flippase)
MKIIARSAISTAALYSAFAIFSIVINIAAQIIFIWCYQGHYAVELSILFGTLSGLPARYFLEKKYIFFFKSDNVAHDGRLFLLYSFMGIFSTAIFWSAEYTFHLIFEQGAMRYIGGVIGLAIGFYVKYQLDKKYVFVSCD